MSLNILCDAVERYHRILYQGADFDPSWHGQLRAAKDKVIWAAESVARDYKVERKS